jgi:hypothetical protein
MAYSVPPTFAHGDYPSAANLNVLSANLTALSTILTSINLAAPVINVTRGGVFINVYRWLHYQSLDGQSVAIVDPTGIGNSQTLPESVTSVTTYDLSGVSWLIPGRQYILTGCKYGFEDWEA